MTVQIGYNSYKFWSDLGGVTLSYETSKLLDFNIKSGMVKQLESYDSVMTLIAKKHNITLQEVKDSALNNQDCH